MDSSVVVIEALGSQHADICLYDECHCEQAESFVISTWGRIDCVRAQPPIRSLRNFRRAEVAGLLTSLATATALDKPCGTRRPAPTRIPIAFGRGVGLCGAPLSAAL